MKKTGSKKLWGIIRPALTLLIICALTAASLAFVHSCTKDAIDEQEQNKINQELQTVLPEGKSFEKQTTDFEGEVYAGKDSAGKIIGYSFKVSESGYVDKISLLIGVDMDGKVTGISTISHLETPNIGEDVLVEDYLKQYKGTGTIGELGTDGIDGKSGATVTSKAVRNAVNKALTEFAKITGAQGGDVSDDTSGDTGDGADEDTIAVLPGAVSVSEVLDGVLEVMDKEGKAIGYRFDVIERGYKGNIKMIVGVDVEGTVTGVIVAEHEETPEIGSPATEEEFLSQFVGTEGRVNLGEEIDAVSGGTVTSRAVTRGVNKALDLFKMVTGELNKVLPDATDFVHLGNGILEGKDEEGTTLGFAVVVREKGFKGPIDLVVGVGTNGRVIDVEVVKHNETPEIGSPATDREFLDLFKGAARGVEFGEGLDAITGGTVTSNAVLKGVNTALDAYFAYGKGLLAPGATTYSSMGTSMEEAKNRTGETVGVIVTVVEEGFKGDITMLVGFDTKGAITGVFIADHEETPKFGGPIASAEFLEQFVGMTEQKEIGDGLDAITGGTVSSTAVVKGVNSAIYSFSMIG